MAITTSTSNINFGSKSSSLYKRTIIDKVTGLSNKVPHRVSDALELNGKGITRNVSLGIALVVILGARYVKSRCPDEKREILTRDLLGIMAAFLGVPTMNKLICNKISKKTKFPLSQGKKLASYTQLESWYSNNNAKNGFEGIAENLNKLGGNLKKIFKHLEKNDLKKLAEVFSDGKETDFSKLKLSNHEFLQKIKENIGNGKLAFMEKALKGDNKILKHAKFLKSVPYATSTAGIIALLGGVLPWYNIYSTNKKYEKKAQSAEQNKNNSVQQQSPIQKFNKIADKISVEQKQIFSQFMN